MNESIAIVGMNGRFPEADNIEAFWENLTGGRESITDFKDEELLAAGVNSALLKRANYVKAGAIVNHIDQFDAAFFGLTPKEAEIMDPQHRLFLELCWETLELSGSIPGKYEGRIGVYAGAFLSTYMLNLFSNPQLSETVGEMSLRHGNDKDYLATRVSYKLNLTGPSITLQTSCSTSLVAIHMAVQSLLGGECDMALAGGVSLGSRQTAGYIYQEGGILSPDGRCRPFDANAKGTIFGNGAGVVALKRLEDAVADGNTIYAVIKGSAINNDGSDKVGYTAPSVAGQSQVIVDALVVAGVEPSTIGMVEAHGTGTPLGDPIEIAALMQAYESVSNGEPEERNHCAIGSVKSNIGHLGAASGVAGFIKAVLSLYHKQIPASLHFDSPNPNIPLADSPFYVNTRLREWEAKENTPRRAAVSSFGMGGTNAHVVLEEYRAGKQESGNRHARDTERLFILSAKTESALEEAEKRLAAYVKSHPDVCLDSVAYTLQEGRKEFSRRSVLIANSAAELVEKAGGAARRLPDRGLAAAGKLRIAFLFSGQGTQYIGMAKELYDSESAYRESFDRCSHILLPLIGADLRELLFRSDERDEAAAAAINQTSIAQPALFAVEYSLAKLLDAWGIRPDIMLGHSIGEYVAACLADVFTLEDALRVVAIRGKLMQQMPSGSMLSVALGENEVGDYLNGSLSVAAVNAPSMCVIAGREDDINKVKSQLDARGIDNRSLMTSHAFHSSMMEPITELFMAEMAKIGKRAPKIPYISNLSGTLIKPEEATSDRYWGEQLRGTVRFAEGVQALMDSNTICLEVGPGQSLTSLIKQQPEMDESLIAGSVLRHPKDRQSDRRILLQAIGRLWLKGVAIDWTYHRRTIQDQLVRLPLPTYPFERKSYWIAPSGIPSAEHGHSLNAELFRSPEWRLTRPFIATDRSLQGALIWGDPESEAGKLLIPVLSARLPRLVVAGGSEPAAALRRYRDQAGSAPNVILYLAGRNYNAAPIEALAQALRNSERSDKPIVRIVTAGAIQIAENEEVNEEGAVFAALVRDIAERNPEAGFTRFDALSDYRHAKQGQMAARWAEELLQPEAGYPDVAYRGLQRYVLTEQTHVLTRSADEVQGAAIDSGVVIFDGEPDELKLKLTEELAQRGYRHFAFVGGSNEALGELLHLHPALAGKIAANEWSIAVGQAASTIDGGALAQSLAQSGRHVSGIVIGFDSFGKVDRNLRSIADWLSNHSPDFVVCLADRAQGAEEQPLSLRAWEEKLACTTRRFMRQYGNLILSVTADGMSRPQDEVAKAIGQLIDRPLARVVISGVRGRAAEEMNGFQSNEQANARSEDATNPPSIEEQVTVIWRELFGIEHIQSSDDFFELGGNSLLAIQLMTRIREHFNIELNIENMFDEPTVGGVTKQVQASLGDSAAEGADELEELLKGLDASSLEDLERELDELKL